MFIPTYAWTFRIRIRKMISIFILFIVFESMLNAQYDVHKVNRFLSKEDRYKIEKANSYLNQGNEILFADYSTGEKDSLFQKMPNYIELSKNMYVGKKIGRLLYDTNDYYKTGFESKVEVYRSYISNYINHGTGLFETEVEGLNDSISNLLRDALLERNKSKAVGGLSKGGSLIHSSNQYYQKAVLFSQQALVYIAKDKWHSKIASSSDSIQKQEQPIEVAVNEIHVTEPKQEKVIEAASIVESKKTVQQNPEQKTPIVIENKVPVEEKKETVLEETKQVVKDEVYYTVQIMADRKTVSESRVKLVYKGNHPIIENQGDGWYRYSFGKFFTLNEAKRALTASKTKGYVVAYKNKDRISLSEAKSWLLSNGKKN